MSLFSFIRRLLTVSKFSARGSTRRVSLSEEVPSDRFVLIVGLMVLFFVGLVGLEVVHMVWMGAWNDVIFNGIMLVVGTIVGAIWGRTAE
jgi:hypothetical protein